MAKKDPHLAREAEKYEKPVPSREFILSTLASMEGPVKRKMLAEHFLIEDPDLVEALRRRIKAMVRDGQLLKTSHGYLPILEVETCQGVIVMEREWEGYLRTESDKNILLSGPTLRGYFNGDEVEAQIIQIDRQGNARGRIINLLQAVVPRVIGRLIKGAQGFVVLPFDRKFSQNITVTKVNLGSAKDGDIVEVEILREEKFSFEVGYLGKVLVVLGDFSTPGIEVEMAVRKFNLPTLWPQAVLKECDNFPKNVKAHTEHKDLCALPLVTIDGEDAKDFDDAVLCENLPQNKGWRLYVAIADVSFYVKAGSALDKEALARGNSTYFPGSVIPMLPEVLSNELCSLKPNVPRLTIVCQMNINPAGIITRSSFYRALIHSHARLTYTEVAEIMKGNAALEQQYESLLPNLQALHALYQALHSQRVKRGAIDFDTTETRILFDQSGKIKNIIPQVRNVAHKMIEESMLAANVCAAKFIQRYKKHTLFRIHDRPPPEKLKALKQFLAELGLDLPGKKAPTAKDFSALLSRLTHRNDKHMIETVMLRSLSQAQYSPENIGHFGLAYESYVHFTSPIRRYPDLLVHRAISDILYDKKQAPLETEFETLGIKCSENERRSDEATRDAQLSLKCHFMQDKVGETYQGMITGVANFGIFVELKDIYIEGLVHVTALGNEYFNYDPTHHRMVGERTRTMYRLGDSVEVTVVRVDAQARKIDLELSAISKKIAKKSDHNRKSDPKSKQSKRRRSKNKANKAKKKTKKNKKE